MQHTAKLNLKKPDLTDYVSVTDLNENMDILDAAVGELKEGTTLIPDLQTDDKTLAGAINEVDNKITNIDLSPLATKEELLVEAKALTTHKAESMPHQFVAPDSKKYKYGFKTNVAANGLIFVYEEVL